ncbi:MAG TPA: lysoplasmalogenase, partial [Anaerolineales bacterium]|nr:lysoplasmalogenase [Anaerolineales bacterium]
MPPLVGPIAVASMLAIVAAEVPWRRVLYVAKPAATILILLQAAFFLDISPVAVRAALLAGLSLSLVGDVLLMLPGDLFKPGLLAFLIAQLAYIAAFSGRLTSAPPLSTLLIPAAAIGAIYLWMRPRLGSNAVAVAVYAGAIGLMAWSAWAVWRQSPSTITAMGFVGALLVLASDTLLGVRRFV